MCLLTALVGIVWFIVYIVALLLLYVSPLMIKSPCIIEKSELPAKPLMVAHRGASAVCDCFICAAY